MNSRPSHPPSATHRLPRVLLVAAVVLWLPCVVVGLVVGALVGAAVVVGVVGAIVGLAVAASVTVPAWRNAEARCLAMIPSAPADRVTHARLYNLVDGLCAGAGLSPPQLFVVPSSSLNAMTFGRDDRHGCLIVTEGLLASMSRIELEAVVAHELAHLRGGDTAGPTVALALFGRHGRGALAELASRVVARQAPDGREATADLAGVSLTRYPPGLVAALERIRADAEPPADTPDAMATMWLRPPGETEELDERIEALRDL